jgi:type I restriction enzyme, R subunit
MRQACRNPRLQTRCGSDIAHDISDEEALYIKEVTEEKATDPVIHSTVTTHREDRVYLEGAYRGQVNGEIQTAYNERGRYEELSDLKIH